VNRKIALLFSAAMIAVGLLPIRAAAIDWKHQEDIGIESTFAVCITSTTGKNPTYCGTNTTVTVTSFTFTGWAIDYQVQTVGGGAQFNIKTSTDNQYDGGEYLQGSGYGAFDYLTSSTVFVAPTVPCNTDVKGEIYAPIYTLTELDGGTSVYFKIEYLMPRQRGQF
jgi:hypothetical protein